MDNVAFGTHDGTSGHMDALCHYAVQGNGPDVPPVVYNGHPQNLDLQGCKADGIDRPRPIHDILLPIMGTPLVDKGYYEDVAQLAAKLKRWEFMVSWSVLRIPGGAATPFTALATF